jgi:6-phosphogluconolactonase
MASGHNSLAVYAVDSEGRLSSLGFASCGGNWPRNFALAPGGNYALVANQYSGDLSVLPLGDDPAIGTAVASIAIEGVSCVCFGGRRQEAGGR